MHCLDKDVISFSVSGGIFATRRTKRFAQMMTFVVIVVLVTVVLYQNVHGLDELSGDTYQQLSYAADTSTAVPGPIKAIAGNRNQRPSDDGPVMGGAGAGAGANHNHIDTVTDYLLKRQHKTYESSVTGTPKPAIITLDDIFITVKTTKLYHNTRLALIIKTWFQLAKQQVSTAAACCLLGSRISTGLCAAAAFPA